MADDRRYKDKNDKPSVATFADHEVITPPNKLRKYARTATGRELGDDPIARAEQALAQMAGEFSSWMNQECDRLDKARREIKAKGFTQATRDDLFRAAHDIKGEAATFGFPLVAAPAESLCRLIEHTPDISRIPHALIDQHVDTMRAIVREHSRPGVDELADALTHALRAVTNEFLVRENSDRPDLLDEILGPPLSPGDPPT